MNWQRARTNENKSKRKEAIYKAAFELFKKNGYDNVSFNGIAAEAGFTKSNMYRYFSSKEEIFLTVFSGLLRNGLMTVASGCNNLNKMRRLPSLQKPGWNHCYLIHIFLTLALFFLSRLKAIVLMSSCWYSKQWLKHTLSTKP
nr:TetR/AcrR family transcriptional regulator [Oceanicoccus sp.]